MISEKMTQLGEKRSVIREIFEYGNQRRKEIGAENVFDFSLGNPSIPAPEKVKETMLNLIANYQRPDCEKISRVSGIPKDWNRSSFNRKRDAAESFTNLVSSLRAKYLMVSFNSEGYISKNEMINILEKVGTVTVLDISYNAFKGSRNLKNRDIYVSEYLFIVKKHKV